LQRQSKRLLVSSRAISLVSIIYGVQGFPVILSSRPRNKGKATSSTMEMVSAIQKVMIGDSEVQIRHQLFLGDIIVTEEEKTDLTGLKYWPTASEPMLQYFQKQRQTQNYELVKKKERQVILELGSGCGLLGIGLASLYKDDNLEHHIILTDAPVNFKACTSSRNVTTKMIVQPLYPSSTLDWLSGNVELNKHHYSKNRVTIAPLLWGNEVHLNTISSGLKAHPSSGATGLVNMVIGSELLYNNDASFVGLLETLLFFSEKNPALRILLGYKERHLGEAQFFDLAGPHFDWTKKRIGRRSNGIYLMEFFRRH